MRGSRPASASAGRPVRAQPVVDTYEAHVQPVHYMPEFRACAVDLKARPSSASQPMSRIQSHGAGPITALVPRVSFNRKSSDRSISRVPDAYPNLFVSGMSVQKQLETQHAELEARCKSLTDENARLRELNSASAHATEMTRLRAEQRRVKEEELMQAMPCMRSADAREQHSARVGSSLCPLLVRARRMPRAAPRSLASIRRAIR